MPPPGHIPRTVAPGGVVAITAADYGGLGAVTETLPAGSGCASSDLADEDIPGGHPMTTPIRGGRYGRDQRDHRSIFKHEVHGSGTALAGPPGENADRGMYGVFMQGHGG